MLKSQNAEEWRVTSWNERVQLKFQCPLFTERKNKLSFTSSSQMAQLQREQLSRPVQAEQQQNFSISQIWAVASGETQQEELAVISHGISTTSSCCILYMRVLCENKSHSYYFFFFFPFSLVHLTGSNKNVLKCVVGRSRKFALLTDQTELALMIQHMERRKNKKKREKEMFNTQH